MKVLIWSNEHGAWWRPQRCGYTPYKSLAGEYSLEEAVQICGDANKHVNFDEQDQLMPTIEPNETIFPLVDCF